MRKPVFQRLQTRRRNFVFLAAALLAAGLVAGAGLSPTAFAQQRSLTLEMCLVSPLHDIEVPAQQAGVLREMYVREGQEVEPEALLALIDDRSAQRAFQIARIQYLQAKYEAENDIDVRFAEAAAAVAKAELEAAVASNQRVPGAINTSELRRLQLAHHRSKLAIEQARRDFQLAQYNMQIRQAELQEAEDQLGRHKISMPLGQRAVVVEILKHRGEWVKPGDPVFRVMQLHRVRVEGFVNARFYGPQEIQRRRVQVLVTLERGRQERFEGQIVSVHPVVQQDGHYRVLAEVVNRRDQGLWILRPGHQVQMTIRLDLPPVPARPEPAARAGGGAGPVRSPALPTIVPSGTSSKP